MKFLLDALHTDSLVTQDQRVQNVSAADAPPASEAKMPRVIEKIIKSIQYQQSSAPSAPWAFHGLSFLLLKTLAAERSLNSAGLPKALAGFFVPPEL